METQPINVYFIGGSHAKRIFNQMPSNPNFNYVNLSKPGTNFRRSVWPEYVNSFDVLVIQLLGNDIFNPNSVYTYYDKNVRKFGLKSFDINHDFSSVQNALFEKIRTYNCKVILISNPIRYFNQRKTDLRIYLYQEQLNKQLKIRCEQENILFINEKLCVGSRRELRIYPLFEKCFLDNVHYKVPLYRQISLKVQRELVTLTTKKV